MGRLLLACVLGCAVFGLVAYEFGFIAPGDAPSTSANTTHKVAPAANLGGGLYPALPWPKSSGMVPERKQDPVVIRGTLAVKDRPEVAAQIAGVVMFVGEDVPEGAMQMAGAAAFLAEPFAFVRVNHGARDIIQPYRRLEDGQMVHENQTLAMVDTAKALADMDMKRVKVISARADSNGAKSIAEEAESKLKTAEDLYARRAIALEEYRSAKLTRDKMFFDSVSKVEALRLAEVEEAASFTAYKQHQIKNKLQRKQSYVQKIYKQPSEAVKDLEPIMQLYSLDPLIAEAQIDSQYGRRLHDGMRVTIEPSLTDSSPKKYPGHVSTVNCLAITNDAKNPLIVSGGEDQTVLIWNRYLQMPVREFKHPDAVKALACSPPSSARNLLVTGCGEGTLRLYDLNVKDQDKALLKEIREQGVAITALAFSPDGKYFACGSADGSIVLWSADTMEPVYPFDEKHGVVNPHNGTITSLHFTPQCKLVSAGKDNKLYVWSLKEKGAAQDYAELHDRSGNIDQLDVSSDGRWMLFDQGKSLQIRSVANNGGMINTLQNPGGVIPFETLALFSPDASLLLTAGAPEGRLQLWQTPTDSARGFEVRQLVPLERAPVTCAVFAPRTDYGGEGSFAVSANKDGQIYLWPLPSRAEVANQPIRDVPVSLISAGQNPGTGQISTGFLVPNPPTTQEPKGRLQPGRSVTIVID